MSPLRWLGCWGSERLGVGLVWVQVPVPPSHPRTSFPSRGRGMGRSCAFCPGPWLPDINFRLFSWAALKRHPLPAGPIMKLLLPVHTRSPREWLLCGAKPACPEAWAARLSPGRQTFPSTQDGGTWSPDLPLTNIPSWAEGTGSTRCRHTCHFCTSGSRRSSELSFSETGTALLAEKSGQRQVLENCGLPSSGHEAGWVRVALRTDTGALCDVQSLLRLPHGHWDPCCGVAASGLGGCDCPEAFHLALLIREAGAPPRGGSGQEPVGRGAPHEGAVLSLGTWREGGLRDSWGPHLCSRRSSAPPPPTRSAALARPRALGSCGPQRLLSPQRVNTARSRDSQTMKQPS